MDFDYQTHFLNFSNGDFMTLQKPGTGESIQIPDYVLKQSNAGDTVKAVWAGSAPCIWFVNDREVKNG